MRKPFDTAAPDLAPEVLAPEVLAPEVLALDHLVYGVPDLAAGVDALEELFGVRPSPGGRHPGWGTANALLALGEGSYLEVLGPDPDPDPGWGEGQVPRPRPFGLDRGGLPRLLAWAVKAPAIDDRVSLARQRGYDPGSVRPMGRRRPDGVDLAWRLAIPHLWEETLDGLVPFLIDWGETPHPAAEASPGSSLWELAGRHPEPRRVASRLAALGVELRIEEGSNAGLEAVLRTPRGLVVLGPKGAARQDPS